MQRRLRLDDQWYRVDLVFFHRRLHCLVVCDLKLGAFTHADAGQLHLYLKYARAHWTKPGENPPVGLILCTNKREAVARYVLGGMPNQISDTGIFNSPWSVRRRPSPREFGRRWPRLVVPVGEEWG